MDAANEYPQLLSYYKLESSGPTSDGTIDVLVASRAAIRACQPEKGAHLLFDVRKTVTRSDLDEAQAKLLLAIYTHRIRGH